MIVTQMSCARCPWNRVMLVWCLFSDLPAMDDPRQYSSEGPYHTQASIPLLGGKTATNTQTIYKGETSMSTQRGDSVSFVHITTCSVSHFCQPLYCTLPRMQADGGLRGSLRGESVVGWARAAGRMGAGVGHHRWAGLACE